MDEDADEDELLHADQEQPEVMRPQDAGGGEDVGGPIAHARVANDPQLGQQRQQPEQGREFVHPDLLRVPDQHRRGGGDQAGPAVVQLPAQLIEHGDYERSGDQRGEPDGELAVAEHADGQPQRQVV